MAVDKAAEGLVVGGPEGIIALSAGLVMGISALAAAWSQSALGSSAMGMVAERPELESKVIIYIALPEVIALFGFIIAFLLASSLGGG